MWPRIVAERDIAYRDDVAAPYNLLDVIHFDDRAPGGRAAIVLAHGGSWRAGDKADHNDVVAGLANAGYVVANVNYRLSGTAKFPAAIEDVKAAIRWLRANAAQYDVDADRIGLMGLSAGGHLAALAAVTSPRDGLDGSGPHADLSSTVRCVVTRAGIYDFREGAPGKTEYIDGGITAFLGAAPCDAPDLARRASPVAYLTRDDPPMMIIHGTADPKIGYPAAQHMADALQQAGVPYEFITIEGGGHGGSPTAQREREVNEGMMGFFGRYLSAT
jgi:acetyl esterase/lipase